MECAICSNSLHEEPDLQGLDFPKRVKISQTESSPGPSSRTLLSAATELCAPRCGHVLHLNCLLTWIHQKSNKTCPICRKTVTEDQLIRIYLPNNVENENCSGCQTTKEVCHQVIAENDKLRKLSSPILQKQSQSAIKKTLELRDKEIAELNAKYADKLRQVATLEQSVEHEKSAKIEQVRKTNRLQNQNITLQMQWHNSKTTMDGMIANFNELTQLYKHSM